MQQNRLFIIVIVVAFGVGGYFFWQNNIIKSELILLKSSDLAKDLEFTQLKLKTAERDLSAFQKEAVSFKTELENLRSSLSKIPLHLDAIDTIERMVASGPDQAGIDRVNSKIAILKNSTTSSAWEGAKRGIDVVGRSWNGQLIADTTIAITRNIRDLIAQ